MSLCSQYTNLLWKDIKKSLQHDKFVFKFKAVEKACEHQWIQRQPSKILWITNQIQKYVILPHHISFKLKELFNTSSNNAPKQEDTLDTSILWKPFRFITSGWKKAAIQKIKTEGRL